MPLYEGVTRGVLMSTCFASLGALMYARPTSCSSRPALTSCISSGSVSTTGEQGKRPSNDCGNADSGPCSWWATALGLSRFNEVFGTVETVNADGSVTHSLSASEQSTGTAL